MRQALNDRSKSGRSRLTSPPLERYTHDTLPNPLDKPQRTLFHSANDRLSDQSRNTVICTQREFLRQRQKQSQYDSRHRQSQYNSRRCDRHRQGEQCRNTDAKTYFTTRRHPTQHTCDLVLRPHRLVSPHSGRIVCSLRHGLLYAVILAMSTRIIRRQRIKTKEKMV